ncbi:MAG: hypothetical protein Q7J78_01145 [Clostridiales bacterium]|nr:hypothetical protein [Clostridiales bacterium]
MGRHGGRHGDGSLVYVVNVCPHRQENRPHVLCPHVLKIKTRESMKALPGPNHLVYVLSLCSDN